MLFAPNPGHFKAASRATLYDLGYFVSVPYIAHLRVECKKCPLAKELFVQWVAVVAQR